MPIQKIMSVPVSRPDGKVIGVVQISRKGLDYSLAGTDFTNDDLKQLERAAAILSRMPFMEKAPRWEKAPPDGRISHSVRLQGLTCGNTRSPRPLKVKSPS